MHSILAAAGVSSPMRPHEQTTVERERTWAIVRNLNELNEYRRTEWELRAYGAMGDARNGCFFVADGTASLRVIASAGGGWDHLSVSTELRCPTWGEMEYVRQLFTGPREVWLQFGVPAAAHINCHPYCLHWWRHQHREVRLPPSIMVGPKSIAVSKG